MFSHLSSFHNSFSSPHLFFIDKFFDLFPLSESTPETELAQSPPTPTSLNQLFNSNNALEKAHIWDYVDRLTLMVLLSVIRLVLLRKDTSKNMMDVKNVFLNGTLSEEVYMKSPPCTSSPFNKLYHYLTWLCPHDTALNFTHQTPHWIVLLLYVDDMIITCNNPYVISDLQHYLGQHFEMKDLRSVNYFLGLEVSRHSDGKKQSVVSRSSTRSGYHTLADATADLL
ncbi:putative mitochondrial protein [Cucumis melo var. makuwa]|uniref:Mitochondrial protein n=1 Tax=Cucumis melo var. makuwa TaxID=1194695 RepID=A0A5A7T0R8_CUCMM|nr:putative mitochondrial protein [Cucumis melo var. makuwa]